MEDELDIFWEHLYNIKSSVEADELLRKFSWYIFLILNYCPYVDKKVGEKNIGLLGGCCETNKVRMVLGNAKWVSKGLKKEYYDRWTIAKGGRNEAG